MLTPPTDLSDSDLEEAIGHAWGVPVASLEYHAVGFGSHHWVATDNQGLRHFVTVDELSSESHFGDEVCTRISPSAGLRGRYRPPSPRVQFRCRTDHHEG